MRIRLKIKIPTATHTEPQHWVEIPSGYARPFDGLIRPTRASSSSVVARQLRGMLQQVRERPKENHATAARGVKRSDWRIAAVRQRRAARVQPRNFGTEGERWQPTRGGKAKLGEQGPIERRGVSSKPRDKAARQEKGGRTIKQTRAWKAWLMAE
ncbi:hypothetical protein EMPG_14795 [Blastomyces silverae]|uniref:Uncharacterized protein n=1 Tax=Blastomyces silverae TaxID=2060906 RepID=A0A0H1BFF7_9EURO|nr:hypothetical protein EMPG_14795 [Blastomyces silverae]